jgi:hypothetical protein
MLIVGVARYYWMQLSSESVENTSPVSRESKNGSIQMQDETVLSKMTNMPLAKADKTKVAALAAVIGISTDRIDR